MLLTGKVAVVTGSSRGIGRAIVLAFAKEGAKVVVNHHKSDKEAEETAAQLQAMGAVYMVHKGSVTDRNFIREMIRDVKEKWGRIDIVVNNAGIIKDRPLLLMSEQDWDDVLSVNLKGAFYLTKEAMSAMISQKDGSVINISSLTALTGREGQTNYGSAKAGLIGFTKSLAREVGRFGIRVNAIAAGVVDTQMTKKLPKEILEMIKTMNPLKRLGKPEEIAGAALFLASDMSSYMTGAVLNVCGGEYM